MMKIILMTVIKRKWTRYLVSRYQELADDRKCISSFKLQ